MSQALPDLIASYWTVAGDVVPLGPPAEEASPWDLRDRAAAAAAAGFRGMGLMHSDLQQILTRYRPAEVRAILADHDIRHLEFEFVTGWLEDGAAGQAATAMLDDLLAASAELGARHIKIGPDMNAHEWPLPHMVERFAALCARARAAGTAVALEIMPWSNLRTIDQGLAVVAGADAPNGGLLLDIWHLARGGVPYADIRKIPVALIQHVELDDADAAVTGTLIEDTLDRRRLCGHGALDVPAFLREIRRVGYAGPMGVEILSIEHRRRPLAEAAVVAFDSTLACLRSAWT
jgi:sugar phosphate isomerase/epimerase